MTEKTPQDRKPKDAPFTFTVKGKKHVLPPITEDVGSRIPGDVTYDAVMRPTDEFAQMRLAFATLEAVKPKPEALEALRALPTDKMMETVGQWMGESSGSSD